ncbi:MAG: hypothetical protein ACLPN5_01970 [Roseiarcus sp.]
MTLSLRRSPRGRSAAVAVALALALSACGRAGEPLPPPNPNAPSPSPSPTATISPLLPGGGYSSEKAKPVVPPNKPFPLDPLLN